MQVYNVVKRKFYPVDPDFGCQGHKLDHVAGIPEDTNGVGTFPDQKQTPKVQSSDLDSKYIISLNKDFSSNIFWQKVQFIGDQNIETMMDGLVSFI